MIVSHMPNPADVATIQQHGTPKYGYQWLEEEGTGDWWGIQYRGETLLQVRNEPPDYPTRTWSLTLGGGYTPKPQWVPFSEVKARMGC